jgi:hypothetical protein
MLLLLTKAVPTLVRYDHPNLGRLLTPRHYTNVLGMVAAGLPWAADNDAFSGFDEAAFSTMLGQIAGLPGCLFVVAPDVVADAQATLDLFAVWAPKIMAGGLPPALAAQDGLEHLDVPWDWLDALFVGGSTVWKMSEAAAQLVAEAHARGKWTHMGRVNSLRRIEHAGAIGCDSADGTSYVRYTDRWLPGALSAVSAPPQQRLSVPSASDRSEAR